ncbi:MAG TPA: heavy metal sensor histidine kinase [Accumulibacter sp.]|uniref:Sensor protein n=1 Tax=Accumulibacter regalis TaxID=522306 RepID=C7RW24_ACCRE|nr:heavy metal sensor histidine kinase [Accumulibacter sp.]MCC2867378.1 heavy metal sensor histidine kinase [Candidatus Accumulibacter phosphatis]MCM8662097.1 heavy metal sensor histidine kinase [Accumulibacter sp.]HNF92449.1 heavy metal sensor histidine kinase [Accumulibacter sp.]HOG02343.1 heavy metal sensor histidine kinase [Accumulibacter sp.]HRF71273.1 heavy metal sensor histidine kinase [Accumulibacter sp.]
MKSAGRKSIIFRLTLLFASASTAVLLVLGLLIGNSVEHHFEVQDMEVLTGKLELTRHALEKVHSQSDLDALPQQLDDSLVGHHGLAVIVVAPSGQTLFVTSGAEFPQVLLARSPDMTNSGPIIWKSTDHIPLRGISAMVKTGIEGAKPAVVAVATDISKHEHFMSWFRFTLWSVVILAALMTGFLGWVAVRRGLAPLHAIKLEAAAITADRLHSRLATESIPIELVDLAETLNQMLARLEDSFRRLSDFSSDIAHELRTPVSNLLTQTQVMLLRVRTIDEYQDVLASNAEELERMAKMIADMLFLAKADNNLVVPNLEAVDLRAEAEGLASFYEAVAEENSVALTVDGSATVTGDRLMLRRAIGNLLSNAFGHTPRGGYVRIQIGKNEDRMATIQVENSGETISPEHLPRLFDRFYRADPSRKRLADGVGLGLALTRSIIQAHGGSVSVRSADGVTIFELQM